MGQAHADAYRRAAMFYPDLPKRPHLYALADQDQAMAERHAAKLGAEKAYGDWRELVNDPQVDVGSGSGDGRTPRGETGGGKGLRRLARAGKRSAG
ncbi:hypothetical protein QVL76_24165 [Klebsiella pneumoniae]|nr:hypothetical protein [Klebsiella pneumoniae]